MQLLVPYEFHACKVSYQDRSIWCIFTHLQIITFFYRSKLSTGNCAIFLHCLKTRFLDFIRWSILRGFKFLGYQSRWRRMDPNFQCMSIWPEKKIGNKIKIDGRNQGFIMRKSNSTLTFLAVSAFLISPRLCSLWETQTAFSLANYLKDSLMSFLPVCILHSPHNTLIRSNIPTFKNFPVEPYPFGILKK